MALPANPLSEPDLSNAFRHDVVFNGGMMGGMVMQEMGGSMGDGASGGMMGSMCGKGDMMNMMHSGKIWFINGVAAQGHVMDPLLILRQARSPGLAMTNDPAWHHPAPLPGHPSPVTLRTAPP